MPDHAESVADDWRDWTWFRCPECGTEWGSQQEEPDREWCGCNSAEFPVRIDRPARIDSSWCSICGGNMTAGSCDSCGHGDG